MSLFEIEITQSLDTFYYKKDFIKRIDAVEKRIAEGGVCVRKI